MPDRTIEIELKLLIEAIYLKYSYDFRDLLRRLASSAACCWR